MRIFKTRYYQIESFKFIALLIMLLLLTLFLRITGWLTVKYKYYLLTIPLIFYLLITIASSGINFWVSHFFPIATAVFIFAAILFSSRREIAQTIREHLADELLLSCRAFDHGSWATSYLNQLQLFSTNLSADQPIAKNPGFQLQETITGFYDLVYKEIDNIHQVALDSSIQVNQASELKRQLLFLYRRI